jgi:hypothetical protein
MALLLAYPRTSSPRKDIEAFGKGSRLWNSVSNRGGKSLADSPRAPGPKFSESKLRSRGCRRRDELKLDVFRIREALPAIKARRRSIDPDLLQAELSMLVGEEQGLPAAKLEDEFKALEEKAEDQDPLEKLKRKMGLGDSSDPKPGKGRS